MLTIDAFFSINGIKGYVMSVTEVRYIEIRLKQDWKQPL